MLGKMFDRILHDDEDDIRKNKKANHYVMKKNKVSKKVLIVALFIFLFSLALRLYSLFYITDPQNAGVEVWYSDVYHHWQIAYLSKSIGFSQGFLRLWDLKGMEFFWGLAHPLVSAVLMALTGSTNIVILRLLSSVMGSLAIVLLFLIVKRYWGWQAGLAAALLGILNPVGIFSDASGMVEPLGIVFMLSGIYFYPQKPFLSGIMLAVASMTRAEYWVLSGLVILGMLLLRVRSGRKPLLFLGYLIPIILYMKYLLDWTGNPIYPVWWNYMGNAVGEWQADIGPNSTQLFIQKIYWVIAAVSSIGIIFCFWKRPKSAPFLLFGFGNWLLWGVVIGMTKYLLSYLPRFWVDRIMLWPYLFLGSLVSIIIFAVQKKRFSKKIKIPLSFASWIMILILIFFSQSIWKTIHRYYDTTYKYWDNFMTMADDFSKVDRGEGRVLVPEEWPPLTYMLVHYKGLEGKRIVGQMFDPYYYIEGDPYNNWGENREIVLDWLVKEDINLMFFPGNKERYMKLIEREPEYFQEAAIDQNRRIYFYYVDQRALKARSQKMQ